MNIRIKLKPSTSLDWFYNKLHRMYPALRDCGIISEISKDRSHISVFVSIDDEEGASFMREVTLISPQVIRVSRA